MLQNNFLETLLKQEWLDSLFMDNYTPENNKIP